MIMIIGKVQQVTYLHVQLCYSGKGYAGTLDTGAVISIPPTIKAGTKIIVNITDEEFMSRA
jgi:hypothetical protein